jgi:flagellar hook-length control protein FliK
MAVFRQLRMQLTPATRHAVLHLVPAELGRIRIHLSVRGGRVSGEIRADREETLAILEAHAPELRAALEQSGFDSADLQLARHGDPSPGRSGEPSSTSGRARSEPVPAAETLPDPVRSILRADRVDTIA